MRSSAAARSRTRGWRRPFAAIDGEAVSSSSQPEIMATMLEQLGLEPGLRVLEIGAGTGYNAALMAHVVGETGTLTSMDIDDDIVDGARAHLDAAGQSRVRVVLGEGGLGYPAGAPYDRIILTVGAWDVARRGGRSCGPAGAWSFRSRSAGRRKAWRSFMPGTIS